MDHQALASVKLFDGMTEDELKHCAKAFEEPIKRVGGERVTRKDDFGYSFFLVLGGSVQVHYGEEAVAKLEKGDCFGEVSLVTGEKRNATVTALESCELAKMMSWNFTELMGTHPKLAERIKRLVDERS